MKHSLSVLFFLFPSFSLLLSDNTRPAPNYYFPSLHHLRYEVEDGITPNARPVRFGYDPKEFPEFSWRGYAIMSPAQVRHMLILIKGPPVCACLTCLSFQ